MTRNNTIIRIIVKELHDFKGNFNLGKYKITSDDVEQVIDFMKDGASMDEAVIAVLEGIEDYLSINS